MAVAKVCAVLVLLLGVGVGTLLFLLKQQGNAKKVAQTLVQLGGIPNRRFRPD